MLLLCVNCFVPSQPAELSSCMSLALYSKLLVLVSVTRSMVPVAETDSDITTAGLPSADVLLASRDVCTLFLEVPRTDALFADIDNIESDNLFLLTIVVVFDELVC